jgi:hypothetical protein
MKSQATKWPADKVERRPIESVTPYARNARTHSDAQVAQIAASMKEWGWPTPVASRWGAEIFTGSMSRRGMSSGTARRGTIAAVAARARCETFRRATTRVSAIPPLPQTIFSAPF